MPSKKSKKPKKPSATALQKQKQSQRVIVNVNQQRRAPAKKRAQPRQQVSYQPIITMSGSVPVPPPYYNPFPIQSSAGFNPTPPVQSLGTPISAPVELPVFAKESPIAIGDEDVLMPILRPVKTPVPVQVREPTISPIINENRPVIRPPPPIIAPSPISIPSPPTSIISKPSLVSDKSQFITPPKPPQSVSSLLSDISKETGINSKSVADFIFKKKKEPVVRPPVRIEVPKSDITTSTSDSVKGDNEPVFFAKESMSVAGAPASLPTISTRPSFYLPSVKGGEFTNTPIITKPKEVVVLKKPELKRNNPYDLFSDNESIARDVPMAEDIASNAATQGTNTKPVKKRPVLSESDSDFVNIIPNDAPAGRRLAPVKERTSKYQSLADLQFIAKGKDIPLTRANGKKKTREELRLEILG